MFELCLFDLDDTLVNTSDIEEVRKAGKNDPSAGYIVKLDAALGDIARRRIYSEALLNAVREATPGRRLGVFTRAPRSYANHVLSTAFPSIEWDVIIAYEDVRNTKPYGDGIHLAVRHLRLTNPSAVAVVGDNDSDICAAYNAGAHVILDKTSWRRNGRDFDAISHVPDACINSPNEILEVLRAPDAHLPDLEQRLRGLADGSPRFDEIGHFKPRELSTSKYPTKISVCGRSFSNHASVGNRRAGHQLTASIEANKSAAQFPDEWVQTVLSFVRDSYPFLRFAGRLVVTSIPHRPERPARLENFLAQLAPALQAQYPSRPVNVEPGLLAYRDGVRSQHGEYLKQMDRFTNVRDHLHVARPDLISRGTNYLVIDDVVTTGASLIYADEYLRGAGATEVKCLSIAKNVGDLYWWRRTRMQ